MGHVIHLISIIHQFYELIEDKVHNTSAPQTKIALQIEGRKKLPALEKDFTQLHLPKNREYKSSSIFHC